MDILSILAMLAPSLFQLLMGKGQSGASQTGTSTGTTTSTTETPAKVAFDPMYYALAPALMKAFGGNYTAMAGAGMPGGTRAMGDVGLGNISDIMGLINQSWPDIMKAMGTEAAPTTPAPTEPVATPKKEGEACDPQKDICEPGCRCSSLGKGQQGRCRRW